MGRSETVRYLMSEMTGVVDVLEVPRTDSPSLKTRFSEV